VTHLPLGPGAEFDQIRAIAKRLGTGAQGLGDDAAVITMGDTNLVVSIDCSVEGVHFRTDWMTFEEIGWRAAAAALSDLAAEGAAVIGALVSVGRREEGGVDSDPVSEIMAGVGAVVASVGGKILGGDLVKSDTYIVDVCVLGTARRPVTRAGGKPGDGIWVTGRFGAPRIVLEGLMRGETPDPRLRGFFATPEPQIQAGIWLAAQGAHAMIDVSDGLAADLGHLAAASGVAIAIEAEKVPLVTGTDHLGALASGEEYELAVALPPAFTPDGAGVQLTRIGEVKSGSGVEVTLGGKRVAVPKGFDHFAT
jgi:thiamine-monophosphate kinase